MVEMVSLYYEERGMEGVVGARRKRGRPRTRWTDCVVADGKENYLNLGMA